MKKIILASKSIDRQEIFNRCKIPFELHIINIDEDQFKQQIIDPIDLVMQLAKAKATKAKEELLNKYENAIILAADTIVEFKGKIIGKASDEIEAFQILKKLSGNVHELITGIAITELSSSKVIVAHDRTSVKFLKLSDKEIRNYMQTGEWKGRAGAYSVNDKASVFIESINGSSSNVMGLPMHKIFLILKNEFNVNLL